MHLKILPAKWPSFRLGLNVLIVKKMEKKGYWDKKKICETKLESEIKTMTVTSDFLHDMVQIQYDIILNAAGATAV